MGGQVGVLALGRAVETDRDVVVRRQAAASLGEIGHDAGVRAAERAAVPGLAKALADSDVTVRWRAAESIGALGALAGDAGAAALAKALLEDQDVGTRRRAAESMGQLGETAGISSAALVKAYRNDTHEIVRFHAAQSIVGVREASVEALSSSEHDYVRGRAAWALGELAEFCKGDALAALLRALIWEPELYVRRRALEAVGKLGKSVGEVGATAIDLARGDGDAFLSCNARFMYEELGIQSTDSGIAALEQILGRKILQIDAVPGGATVRLMDEDHGPLEHGLPTYAACEEGKVQELAGAVASKLLSLSQDSQKLAEFRESLELARAKE